MNAKVLVVDDIFVNRYLIRETLRSAGVDCLEAENGKKAIEILEKENVTLILMDIEMPVMNGIETVHYIKNKMPASRSSIPIVALTAHNPQLFFNDYRDVKFDDILTKPYTVERVMAIVSRYIKE